MTVDGSHVWGVDVAISHLAFAVADLASDTIEVETLITRTDEREGARLGLLDRRLRIYASQLARRYPPACVWIEQPSGKFRSPQLLYATGVIQAALFEALAVPVWTIPSGKWKKRAVGYGNASKDQVRFWVANTLRIDCDTQDEHDAICIAHAGRDIFSSRTWEEAA